MLENIDSSPKYQNKYPNLNQWIRCHQGSVHSDHIDKPSPGWSVLILALQVFKHTPIMQLSQSIFLAILFSFLYFPQHYRLLKGIGGFASQSIELSKLILNKSMGIFIIVWKSFEVYSKICTPDSVNIFPSIPELY